MQERWVAEALYMFCAIWEFAQSRDCAEHIHICQQASVMSLDCGLHAFLNPTLTHPFHPWLTPPYPPGWLVWPIAANFWGRKLSRFCGYSRKCSSQNLGVWCLLAVPMSNLQKFSLQKSYFPSICESFLRWRLRLIRRSIILCYVRAQQVHVVAY